MKTVFVQLDAMLRSAVGAWLTAAPGRLSRRWHRAGRGAWPRRRPWKRGFIAFARANVRPSLGIAPGAAPAILWLQRQATLAAPLSGHQVTVADTE